VRHGGFQLISPVPGSPTDFDVALLELTTPSTRPTIQIAGASARSMWEPGDVVTSIGWGATYRGGPSVADLRTAMTRIVDDATATDADRATFRRHTMVAAFPQPDNATKGLCDGDSGGPLIAQGIGLTSRRLVGIASWSACGNGKPSVYARIGEGPLARWITETVGQVLPNEGLISPSGDVNGDGRDDIVTFTKVNGNAGDGDVWVALSQGSSFSPAGKWHEYFAEHDDMPMIADVNGDGRDDVVAFTRGQTADVYVALSNGMSFGPATRWHDYFVPAGELPAVGDLNADGRDDIVTVIRSNGQVWVALSTGTGFGAAVPWGNNQVWGTEIPAMGDVNGDRRADLVTFTRTGTVRVSLNTGTAFEAPAVWHSNFCYAAEVPALGDVDGDGRQDILTVARDRGIVWVAVSSGSSFVGSGARWHENFGWHNEIIGTGDFTGDGSDDAITFTRGETADVFVSRSNGSRFVDTAWKWQEYFAPRGQIPAGASIW
jgi:hypothetical protein